MSVAVEYARYMISEKSRYKDSTSWRDRCKRMPANQVLAVYNTMLHKGEFNKKVETKEETSEEEYIQMSLFDFGLEIENSCR